MTSQIILFYNFVEWKILEFWKLDQHFFFNLTPNSQNRFSKPLNDRYSRLHSELVLGYARIFTPTYLRAPESRAVLCPLTSFMLAERSVCDCDRSGHVEGSDAARTRYVCLYTHLSTLSIIWPGGGDAHASCVRCWPWPPTNPLSPLYHIGMVGR